MENIIDVRSLIKQCVDDEDESAWELFVRTYSRIIWNAIHKTFRFYTFRYSKEDAEDIYSAVFSSLIEDDFRKLRQFRSAQTCAFTTWLSVIASRMTIDHMRRDKNRLILQSPEEGRDILDILPSGGNTPTECIEEQQKSRDFEKAREYLSARDRMVYDLLYIREEPPEEVARALGVSVSSVYSRKHRIIKKLKKHFEEMQENGR